MLKMDVNADTGQRVMYTLDVFYEGVVPSCEQLVVSPTRVTANSPWVKPARNLEKEVGNPSPVIMPPPKDEPLIPMARIPKEFLPQIYQETSKDI